MSLFLSERRRAVRVNYVCEVLVRHDNSQGSSQRLSDISTSGAFIDTLAPFSAGTILHLQFPMNGVIIEARAEVRFAMSQIGMGVRFLDLSPEHQRVIQNFAEEKSLGNHPASATDASSLPGEPEIQLPPRESDRSPAAALNMVLSGDFTFLSIFDVVQMIDSSRLTGTLEIRLPQESGAIHFNDGLIVGAHSQEASGAAALADFLSAIEGSFTFRQSDAEHPVTLAASSNTGLLLDLLTVPDEEKTPTLVEA